MPTNTYHHGDLKNALINAGIEIVKKEGTQALSLRKAARKAGVSHSAPYAHFKDKQALIAAISTHGLKQLYERLSQIAKKYDGLPLSQLHEVAWEYAKFGLTDPAYFKFIFSGSIEHEYDYPEFVEVSHRNFALVVDIIRKNQKIRIIKPENPELVALSVWSIVHGFINLAIEKQVPSSILQNTDIKKLLVSILDQVLVTS
jgi:AcrR family transcriptional regulator